MEGWEIAAREAIRDTIARYAHAADTGRFDELAALFVEDGALEIEGLPALRGRGVIVAFLAERKLPAASAGATRRFIRHHVTSVRIDVASPNAASAKSYFLAITERGPDHWGVYRDSLVRVGDEWLFASRRVRVDGRLPAA